ncbi:MAG: hypothetical protein ACRDF8_11075, partial [Chloroflexota bacterium]
MLSKPPAGLVVPGLLAVACALAAVISVLHSPPAAAPSPASQPLDVAYDNGVILLGSDVQVTGAQLHAMVYFREPATPVALAGTVRLTTLGQPWASAAFHVPAATAGALPRVPVAMPLPPGTPAGSYGLELTLRNAAGDEVHYSAPRLTYKLPFIAAVDLGPVTIPRIVPGSPGGQPPATGAFGPLTLERWSPPTDARQGALVPVNLWWRPSSPLPANLVCSLHVVDAAGTLWAVRDAPPREGHNPTQAWAPGVTVRNQQEILLPPQIPPGTYTLRAGWYDQNGQQPFGPRNVAIGSFHVRPAQAPSAASVTIPIRFAHAFPDGLDLLGYQLTSRQVTSGTDLPLSLFWRVGHRPAAQPVLTLSLGSETLRVPLPAPTDLPAGTTFETRSALPTSGVSATLTIGLGLAPAVAGSGEQITLPSATELRLPESVMVAAPVRL